MKNKHAARIVVWWSVRAYIPSAKNKPGGNLRIFSRFVYRDHTMTPSQRLQLEQSEKRQRINELLAVDELSDEQRAELENHTKRMQNIEIKLHAAIMVESENEHRALHNEPDAESR